MSTPGNKYRATLGGWIHSDTGLIMWFYAPSPRWELRAVRIEPEQPAPKYDVGKWVVPLNGKLEKIKQIGDFVAELDTQWVPIPDLRPAVREDFMVTFGGVKVWMEKHEDERMREYFDGNSGSCFRWIDEWQITRNRAAGIMEMPKEFWT